MSGRALNPQDCHLLVNLIYKEITGQDASIQKVDSSNFVSVGETILSYGTESTLNAMGVVLGKTLFGVRPYDAKLKIINALDTGLFGQRIRKVSFYARDAKSAGNYNTQLNGANLKDGRDNTSAGTLDSGANSATGSMWEQNQPKPVEMYFQGSSVWQDSTTIYEYQLKAAFSSEANFSQFVSGILTEKGNDIESEKESFNRMTLLNYIAGVYDMDTAMPGSKVNLTAAFNTKFGTSYSSADLRTVYLEEFLKFFVSEFQIASDYMTNRSNKYHWTPSANDVLLRHTPKDSQRAILFNPLFTEAKAWVMPALFNPQYLSIDDYEGVDFWQNINTPSKIDVEPAIPDTSDPTAQKKGNRVQLDYVVGILFDKDAIMTNFMLDDVSTSPLEARKHYRNLWYTMQRNSINDFTENAIIFYMAD